MSNRKAYDVAQRCWKDDGTGNLAFDAEEFTRLMGTDPVSVAKAKEALVVAQKEIDDRWNDKYKKPKDSIDYDF